MAFGRVEHFDVPQSLAVDGRETDPVDIAVPDALRRYYERIGAA